MYVRIPVQIKSPQLDLSVCCCKSGYTKYTVWVKHFCNGLFGVVRNTAGPHAIVNLHHLRFEAIVATKTQH